MNSSWTSSTARSTESYEHVNSTLLSYGRRPAGRRPGPTLWFARRLAECDERTLVRYVLVPGFSGGTREVDAFIEAVASLDNVQRVEILPFHKLGAVKYERLRIPFPLADTPYLGAAQVAAVRSRMLAGGLQIT